MKMKVLMGYIRTIKNYLQTKKGKHDVVDYLKAICLILITFIILLLISKIITYSELLSVLKIETIA